MVGLRTWGLILAAFAFAGCGPKTPDTAELPMTMVWAWERPEDLRFVDPAEVGVAFLAATVVLTDDGVVVAPRMQPLLTAPDTTLVAVFRVEADRPALTPEQALAAAVAIAGEVDGRAEIAAVQLDFDSTVSQREFHRDLLTLLSERLPQRLPLTMTALASWCLHDAWLDDLPVAAAVPMFFDMGVEAPWVDRHLAGGGDVLSEICGGDVGRATYGPDIEIPGDRRIWWFHDAPWSHETLDRAKESHP